MSKNKPQKVPTFFLLGALIALAFVTSTKAQANTEVPFEKSPQACQCFPHDASSKQYVAEGKRFGYVWRSFTCDFTCVLPYGSTTIVKGTDTQGYWMFEDGDEFVCRGFRMGSMDTPLGDRMSVQVIKGIQPFTAANSGIAELEQWASEAGCK